MAEPAVGSCTMSGGQEVLAYYVALLLPSWSGWSKGGIHGFAN